MGGSPRYPFVTFQVIILRNPSRERVVISDDKGNRIKLVVNMQEAIEWATKNRFQVKQST